MRERTNPHVNPGGTHTIEHPTIEKGSSNPRPLPQTPGPAPYVNTPCERVNETGDEVYRPQRWPAVPTIAPDGVS